MKQHHAALHYDEADLECDQLRCLAENRPNIHPNTRTAIYCKLTNQSAYNEFYRSADKPMTAIIPSYQSKNEPDDLELIFADLVQQVLAETRTESSTLRIAIHPAYQQIIGLGKPAIPLLLRQVEHRSGRWFWALKAITRQDPVSSSERGKTRQMIEAWLSWGKQQGYQW